MDTALPPILSISGALGVRGKPAAGSGDRPHPTWRSHLDEDRWKFGVPFFLETQKSVTVCLKSPLCSKMQISRKGNLWKLLRKLLELEEFLLWNSYRCYRFFKDSNECSFRLGHEQRGQDLGDLSLGDSECRCLSCLTTCHHECNMTPFEAPRVRSREKTIRSGPSVLQMDYLKIECKGGL